MIFNLIILRKGNKKGFLKVKKERQKVLLDEPDLSVKLETSRGSEFTKVPFL